MKRPNTRLGEPECTVITDNLTILDMVQEFYLTEPGNRVVRGRNSFGTGILHVYREDE